MIQLPAVTLIALLASAGAALAQTQVLAGDKGFSRQTVRGAKLYDATTATVRVEQGKNNIGYKVVNSPAAATFLGGKTLGTGINRTEPWAKVYAKGNGGCILLENSPALTVRRHYGEFCWDGIKVASGSNNWRVEDSWLKHIRDDAIEADSGGAHSGTVQRTFFEGVHTFLSVTPGNGAKIVGRPQIAFQDNLMSLGCGLDNGRPCEDRAKRLQAPYSRPTGSGQAFKAAGCGEAIDLLFRNNAVMMDTGLNTGGANLALFQCMKLKPGSTGNTFFWLGGCNFAGLKMTTLHGACVPASFKLDPAVFTQASNDRAAWQARVARWQSQVWKGTAPMLAAGLEPESDHGAADRVVVVDVKPHQCSNRVRADRDGTIPVLIAGTEDFDVRELDPDSIRIAGVSPMHERTLVTDFGGLREGGACAAGGADGHEDLLLRVSSAAVVRALGPVPDDGLVAVPLTGVLADGTLIRGEDAILVIE